MGWRSFHIFLYEEAQVFLTSLGRNIPGHWKYVFKTPIMRVKAAPTNLIVVITLQYYMHHIITLRTLNFHSDTCHLAVKVERRE